MSSTGFVIVGTGNEAQRSGTKAWSNEANVTADDGSVASSASASSAGEKTWTLYGHNLGLSLPDGAVIRGIEARIEGNSSGTNLKFDDVVLRKADGTFTTTDRSDAGGRLLPDHPRQSSLRRPSQFYSRRVALYTRQAGGWFPRKFSNRSVAKCSGKPNARRKVKLERQHRQFAYSGWQAHLHIGNERHQVHRQRHRRIQRRRV